MAKMEDEKSVRVIQFSGETKEYEVFEVKFRARAQMRGYGELLDENYVIPTITEASEDPMIQKKIDDDRAKNRKGMADLLLGINGKTSAGRVAFDIVRSTIVNNEHPSGHLPKAMKLLREVYKACTMKE